MIRHGFPLKGLRFEWDNAIDYTPEQQVAYETMIADRYEVDPAYFAEKYSMPVGERRAPSAPTTPPEDEPTETEEENPEEEKEVEDEEPKQQQNARPFFD